MTPKKAPLPHAGRARSHGVRRSRAGFVGASHAGEDGIEAVETIIILVVAVIILLALVEYFWPGVFEQLQNKISSLFSSSPS
jgi:hypothetical protein